MDNFHFRAEADRILSEALALIPAEPLPARPFLEHEKSWIRNKAKRYLQKYPQ